MLHLPRYSCLGTSRLAKDTGLAKSTISKLLHGRSTPLYTTASRVLDCLERALDRTLDHREVFSEDGSYPTPHICALVGCRGCLPDAGFTLGSVTAGRWTGDNFEFPGEPEDRQ